MAPRISLALAIHNHQPVGNFGWVFAEVYDRAYLPMLEALERHPGVRLSLHYTGPLLEWLEAERPEFVARLTALVRHGQVELLGGGLYEPVLASLPERDRVDQLSRMAGELERLTGTRPRGAWLAERVWEPDLPTALAGAGYQWTILDDQHFRAAAIPEENLWGAYTTEDQGNLLTVFGTEQGLRYRIPFGGVEDVIEYLRQHATEAGDRVGMMGDDGEKFGAWPTTYEHCWGQGRWVERFFEALEANAEWLSTITPSQWLDRQAPIGRVYVPTSSYAEMGEWALPPDETVVFTKLLHDAVAEKRPDARWLRGGFWRNFQVKYREINDLHKQMLRTSRKVAAMPEGRSRIAALDHLHRGQSNDCYWHGLFGGIYISHMRLATYEHLVAAEDAADRALGTVRLAETRDLDMDGLPEAFLAEPGQVVTVKPSEGGGIASWDIRAAWHALGAVLRRRPEAYHETLRAHEAKGPIEAVAEDQGAPASIHDLVMVKEEGLSDLLFYDDHERRSGLVRFLEPSVTPAAVASASERELGDFRDGDFRIDHLAAGQVSLSREGSAAGQPMTVTKTVRLGGDRMRPELVIDIEVHHRGDAPVTTRLGIELSLHLLGGGGNPSAWYDVRGKRTAHDSSGTADGVDAIGYGNDWIGVAVEARPSPAADAWWAPIETVSNSESGFERVYQGSGLLLSWPVTIAPGESRRFSVSQVVTVATDRTAVEAGAGA
ncbi:MAG TPA: alpha-amylase/4-alpha-glucanotransferase domain-containing protein [Candidatus Limnocylindrales bacterium]|nr:alpha-amylase/4-alpha-glucanotransferase domain-containing protein [Candidatus Limnocylindrales bacterium]